jgi:predicted RNA-binding Zn-ribbon protein involved in translation (DUF1610 family)
MSRKIGQNKAIERDASTAAARSSLWQSQRPSSLTFAGEPYVRGREQLLAMREKQFFLRCPKCEVRSACREVGRIGSSVNFRLYLLGGIVFTLLYYFGKKTRFACGNCGELFEAHTTGSRVALFFFWLLICWLVVCGIVAFCQL